MRFGEVGGTIVLLALALVLGACSSADDQGADDADQVGPTTTEATGAAGSGDEPGEGSGDEPLSDPAGSIDEIETPVEDPGQREPVSFEDDAPFGDGVVARIAAIESTEVTTELPGEIGGPAVVIDLELRNGSDRQVSLDSVTVDLVDLGGAPLLPVTTEPAEPLSGQLAPGASGTGRYVFSVPVGDRDDVLLTVKYSGDAPAVVLTGSLPND
jgi:hypothetical protein